MKTYLLFGIEGIDLDRARSRIENALGITMVPHDSLYLGEYYRAGGTDDESFILQRNFDELDEEWMEPGCKEYGLLFYANDTKRPDFIGAALAEYAKLIRRTEL